MLARNKRSWSFSCDVTVELSILHEDMLELELKSQFVPVFPSLLAAMWYWLYTGSSVALRFSTQDTSVT